MVTKEQEYRDEIKQALYRHGHLALLFYRIDDELIVKKWGNREQLEIQHQRLFDRYSQAGLPEEAESLILMDLPDDEDAIYRILHCGGLKQMLKDNQLMPFIK